MRACTGKQHIMTLCKEVGEGRREPVTRRLDDSLVALSSACLSLFGLFDFQLPNLVGWP
jgi:hypothetical protein